MDYIIYTDGSCGNTGSKAASAYIIMTKNNYVASDAQTFSSIYILEAELKAVLMSLRQLKNRVTLTAEDNIVIYIDSVNALEYCRGIILGNAPSARTVLYKNLSRVIKDYIKSGANLEFKKVHAHKKEMNPNKFADKLARSAIQHSDVF